MRSTYGKTKFSDLLVKVNMTAAAAADKILELEQVFTSVCVGVKIVTLESDFMST